MNYRSLQLCVKCQIVQDVDTNQAKTVSSLQQWCTREVEKKAVSSSRSVDISLAQSLLIFEVSLRDNYFYFDER